jgi:hypothetical protein
MTPDTRRGTRIIWIGVIALIALRQDVWFWNDPSLVLGILPVGLAWQIVISIAAAVLWLVATKIAWPSDESYLEITPSGDTSGDMPHTPASTSGPADHSHQQPQPNSGQSSEASR